MKKRTMFDRLLRDVKDRIDPRRISRRMYDRPDMDAFAEQNRLIKEEKVTIFDVGAYDGQVSLAYCRLFPQSSIYSFEPFPQSFSRLHDVVQGHKNIHPHNLGFSDRSQELELNDNSFSATNSLLPSDSAADQTWGANLLTTKGKVSCQFLTIDEFTTDNNISQIDILKLDTQGSETKILDGAKMLLKANKIKLIFTEIIIMPTYVGQNKLWETLKIFDGYGLQLHNIYNLNSLNGRMRQVDAIFTCAKA